MKRQFGLKHLLDPTPEQAARLRLFYESRTGHARFVWNQALAECLAAREKGQRVSRYGTMAGWVTNWKRKETTALSYRRLHRQPPAETPRPGYRLAAPLQPSPPIITRRAREAFRDLSHNGMQVVYNCPT